MGIGILVVALLATTSFIFQISSTPPSRLPLAGSSVATAGQNFPVPATLSNEVAPQEIPQQKVVEETAIGNQDTSASAVQAVSLRGLQEKLQACRKPTDCPSKLMPFEGLTHIMGYLIDRPNQDIIVFGQSLPDRPPLNVEHFIIALRNA
ncbi:MAG: hypothetical protein ACRERU_22575 [Methylococcales bacterium]